ncbi:MAG TPA: substrate-binding domain-containing protein, partial [Phytomonospora sp.]
GFDDLPFTAWAGPPLTTVRQPLARMGETAVGLIAELAAGGRPAEPRVELGTTLVVRESTGPCP